MEEVKKEYEQHTLKKGIIYCIICKITGEKYYGSTFRSLEERIRGHKKISNKCISKQIIERGNYDVEIVLECYVEHKRELEKLESNFIRNNECINQKDAYQSEEELKEYGRNFSKQWYQNNREKKKEYKKIYCKINVEKVRIYENNYKNTQPHIECECGSKVKKHRVTEHYRTKKHQKYLNSLNK